MEKELLYAARNKLRFATTRGPIAVEDLFDLPLTSSTGRPNLDDVAKALYARVQADKTAVSFVDDSTAPADTDAAVGLEIVKYVIGIKKAERAAAATAAEKAATKQKLLELIASKKDQELGSKSIEELNAMLNSI